MKIYLVWETSIDCGSVISVHKTRAGAIVAYEKVRQNCIVRCRMRIREMEKYDGISARYKASQLSGLEERIVLLKKMVPFVGSRGYYHEHPYIDTTELKR